MTAAARLPVLTQSGQAAGHVEVPAVFSARPNRHALWLGVTIQLGNRRAGTHATRTRGQVSGGGRKPWKQKHLGRARQGSTRAPQWRHGGVVFGPVPRSHARDLPTGVRRVALRSAVADRVRAGALAVVETPALEGAKTRDAAAMLRAWNASGPALLLTAERDESLLRAFRNLASARTARVADVSAYDVLTARRIFLTREALDALARRCQPPARGGAAS